MFDSIAKTLAGLAVAGSAVAVAATHVWSRGKAAPNAASYSTKATAEHPNVVELFQSQGCSSCPPANDILNSLADRPDIIGLSFAVTYWDQLGWKDTFDNPAYTARQWDYAHAQNRGTVATPQFVVNGRTIVPGGANGPALAQALRGSGTSGGPAISATGAKVTIGDAHAAAPATVWLVRYDPRVRNVSINRGENGGRTLPHRNIVTAMRAVGTWSGKPLTFDQPAYRDPHQRSAVLVQQGKGGPIIAARVI
jgi:hypothetical protein